MMEVKIGRNYTVQIGHLTQIGKLNDVLAIGNEYRKKKGLREIEMAEWLRKESTWEFIIKVFNEESKKSNWQFASLDIGATVTKLPRDLSNRISFGEILKKKDFNLVIKSQRGGKPENRGYWANLFLLLDLASFLDVDLKYEMYEVFINQNILLYRDVGGDNFKEFNKIVDTLPDRIGKNNTGISSHLSLLLREKLSIFDTRGYNQKEHDSLIQQKRGEYLKTLTSMVEVGFIKDYDNLKEVLIKI
ncbi:KilA-N domain-containing protein [Thiovulum sp. ES]|nr:KilA-N domain-containing protein [Thiovulum sp. ES]